MYTWQGWEAVCPCALHAAILSATYPMARLWWRRGEQMAVTVQMQFESVVTELYQDAFVGSSIENGTTIIQFDLRKLDSLNLSAFVDGCR